MEERPSDDGKIDRRLSKTAAKQAFALTDSDLATLPYRQKKNPVVKTAAPMRLYLESDLQKAAIAKYGSLDGLDATLEKREALRAKRTKTTHGAANFNADAASFAATPAAALPHGPASSPHAAAVGHGGMARRIKIRRPAPSQARGRHVVYWMQTAVRARENPALALARDRAVRSGVPLCVVALLMPHRHATARRWMFLLQGLRDVGADLETQGIRLYVFVDASGDASESTAAPPHDLMTQGSGGCGLDCLAHLAQDAALLVTEEMPVSPHEPDVQALLRRLGPASPCEFATVDCACVVPMGTTAKSYGRAYEFRSATQTERVARLRGLPDFRAFLAQGGLDTPRPPGPELEPALAPFDVCVTGTTDADLREMVAKCRGVDHTIPEAGGTKGGAAEGYRRWERFVASGGLRLYAARRNNALQPAATSRLSAYHHYGMVSPFRIAAESQPCPKLADEFLTWRELGYHFCFHLFPNHGAVKGALPEWAAASLNKHSRDVRPHATYAALCAAATGDALWNAAQRSLLRHGELHNNVRMTWGKRFVDWVADPDEALLWALDINHRFALDGCNPASYAGVLWCFGTFDGPKGPERPVTGMLRCRPSSKHNGILRQYEQLVDGPTLS